MSDLERQLDVAYEIAPDTTKEYYQIKNRLRYLNYRFDVIVENSRTAGRGVATTTTSLGSSKSHSNFMKRASIQLTNRRVCHDNQPKSI